MAPRQTMNSLYGRQAPAPRTPRSRNKGQIRPPAHENERGTEDNKKGPEVTWLLCRDDYGVRVHVSHSETGEGVHLRWLHPDIYPGWQSQANADAVEADDDVDIAVDDYVTGRFSTPQPGASNQVLQTPLQLHPFDAGSVIRTPVKKPKPLQRSPERIGDHGIGHCIAPPHSSVNLAGVEVEQLQDIAGHRILIEQVAKLEAQKEVVDREDAEEQQDEDMEMDEPSAQGRVRTVGSDGTIINTDERDYDVEEATEQPFITGPIGERLDLQGRPLFGPQGTMLVDPNFITRRGLPPRQPLASEPTEIISFPDRMLGTVDGEEGAQRRPAVDSAGLRNTRRARQRVGPEDTELIDI